MKEADIENIVREAVKIREKARAAKRPSTPCLTDETMHSICERTLPEAQHNSAIDHLYECDRCREDLKLYFDLVESVEKSNASSKYEIGRRKTMVSFSQLLRSYRIKRNLTQRVLAKKVGVTRSYIALLEQGMRRNPSRRVLLKIAEVLDLSRSKEYELFLAAQKAAPSIPLMARSGSLVLDALAEILALPRDSLLVWDKLTKVFEHLTAMLSEQDFTRKQRKKANMLSLITQGYAYSGPAGKGRGKQPKRKKVSTSRSQRDKARIANQLHSLLEIFVDGRIPISTRAALAEELLSLAKSRCHEYESKHLPESKTKGRTGPKKKNAR